MPGVEDLREWLEQGQFGDGWIFHKHYRYSPQLCDLLESIPAHLVTIIRDPYDVFVSLYSWIQDEVPLLPHKEHRRLRHTLVGKPIDHPDVLAWLRGEFGKFMVQSNRWLHSGRAVVVRYEDLSRDPVAALRRATDQIQPVDPERIERAVDARTRVLVVCNPVNPTGRLLSAEELAGLAAVAARHRLTVLTDEAYERYVYEGHALESALGHAPEAVVVRSIGKSYALPAWRLGYLVAPAPVVEACVRALEADCIRCPYVGQRIAFAALEGPQDWLADVAAEYERYRDAALHAVHAAGLTAVRPLATPFLFLNLAGAGEEELLEAGVPAVPGRFFQAPGYARLPVGGAGDELASALRTWSQSLSNVRT